MSFKGQVVQIQPKRLEGVVTNVIMSKYEDNPLITRNVVRQICPFDLVTPKSIGVIY